MDAFEVHVIPPGNILAVFCIEILLVKKSTGLYVMDQFIQDIRKK
jgi:hypothetical protein